MVKTDYKPGDYITWRDGTDVRLIAGCKINGIFLDWSQNFDDPDCHLHAWELEHLRLATSEQIIAAGFKPKEKSYNIW
jgi:hypothetical protein